MRRKASIIAVAVGVAGAALLRWRRLRAARLGRRAAITTTTTTAAAAAGDLAAIWFAAESRAKGIDRGGAHRALELVEAERLARTTEQLASKVSLLDGQYR